jgi:hypothetical protein
MRYRLVDTSGIPRSMKRGKGLGKGFAMRTRGARRYDETNNDDDIDTDTDTETSKSSVINGRVCPVCLDESVDLLPPGVAPWGCGHCCCHDCTVTLVASLSPCPMCRTMWTTTIHCATAIVYVNEDRNTAVGLQRNVFSVLNTASIELAVKSLPCSDTIMLICKVADCPYTSVANAMVIRPSTVEHDLLNTETLHANHWHLGLPLGGTARWDLWKRILNLFAEDGEMHEKHKWWWVVFNFTVWFFVIRWLVFFL